jgi:hypothetical protein
LTCDGANTDGVCKPLKECLRYTKRPRDREIINKAIPYLGYCYRETRLENYTFDLPVFDRTERREFYFSISNVFEYKPDTIKVKINFGTYDGIGLGALGTARGVTNELVLKDIIINY